jgi:hypothetical protein
MTAICALWLQLAHAAPCQTGGPAADPFQPGNRAAPFTAEAPGDFAYDSHPAKAAPGVTAPPLDLFGSASDFKNAATAMSNTPKEAGSLSNGVLTVRLTQSGLNVVNIRVPDGTAISGIDIVTGTGVVPAGLILNIEGNHIAYTGDRFNLGSLDNRQVLLNFGAGAVPLSVLTLKLAALAPLAATRFDKGAVSGALVTAGKPGLNDTAFGAPLQGYGASGGGTTAPDGGR